MRILVVLLLALVLTLPAAGASYIGVNMGMLNFPVIQVPSYSGNAQIQKDQVSSEPIIFAPPNSLLLTGGYTGNHFMPRLETGTWSSSLKTSPINQLLTLMSHGIGSR